MFWQKQLQLYIIIMSRHQKYKVAKKSSESVSALQQNLFQQLESINSKTEYCHNPDSLFAEFQEYDHHTKQVHAPKTSLLNKAKQLTYSNKGKIQKMRKEIKRLQEGEGAEFMTGVGLFESREPIRQLFQEPDETAMLLSLKQGGDDLQELRRMIRKTENNLKMYSHSIYNTQKEVVSAAEKCGRDLDVGLAIKINRCNLDLEYSQAGNKNIQQIRRRTFSSQNPRRFNKH